MITDLKPYPAYKDSGVEWLGKMPESWEVRRLDGCVSINLHTLAEMTPASFEFNYLDISSVDTGRLVTEPEWTCFGSAPSRARRVVHPGDTLVSTVRTYLKATWCAGKLDGSYVCSTGFAVLTPPVADAPRFWGYVAQSEPFTRAVVAESVGVAYPAISDERFRALRTVLPSSKEQAAIARFLDHVDSRIRRFIATKERLIELLEEERQAVVHRAVTRGLDPDVPLKRSGIDWLGDVPKHWEILDLGRSIDVLPGFAFPSGGFSSKADDIRLLRGVNVAPGEVRWDEVVRWPEKQQEGLDRYRLEVGDLVLGLDRPVISAGTRIARVTEKDTPSLLLQRVARIRTLPGLLSGFVYLLLGGEVFRRYMTPIFTGVSVPHLSPEQVKNFRIGLPPLGEQEDIVGRVFEDTECVDAAVAAGQRHITLLCEFRTRLISDVVTGKLDVREAAERLPDDPGAADAALDEQLEEVIA